VPHTPVLRVGIFPLPLPSLSELARRSEGLPAVAGGTSP